MPELGLVNKPVYKKKKTRHIVEGRNPLAALAKPIASNYYDASNDYYRYGDNKDNLRRVQSDTGYDKKKKAYDSNRKKVRAQNKQYAREDAARARIKPIADPEAGQAARRKRAARRRMRGRLGTLLSERESLG